MIPLYISSSGDPLFAAYHPAEVPVGAVPTRTSPAAVVLCPPFGQEAIRSHKCWLALAKRLARQGTHVLRFAYRGTDDSALWSDEILSLQDWRADIVAAKEQLKRLSGCTSVMLVGLRLGANLATQVAANSDDVHSVVLWEPIESGREYLENLRHNQQEMIDLWHAKIAANNSDEVEELFSSRYQRSLLAEIEQIHLSTEALNQPTLIVAPASESAGNLVGTGVTREGMEKCIESIEPDGWRSLDQLEVVWWRPQSVHQLADSIHEMLSRVESRGWHRQPALASTQTAPGVSTIGNLTLTTTAQPSEVPAEVPPRSPGFRESVQRFGHQSQLLGILTEPDQRLEQTPLVLMLNAGIVHRVGPFRLHVNLARVLAKHGIASFRLDLAGLGDSQHRTGKLDKDQRVQRDVAEAMEHLASLGMGNQFILFGLCSGAYQSHNVAVGDSRVVGAVFLDGIVFRTLGYYLRHKLLRLFRPRFWRNAIQRRWLNWQRKGRPHFAEEGNRLAEAEYFQVQETREAIATQLRHLQSRSADLLFVYTGDYADFCGRKQFREMFGITPNEQVQVDYLPQASHTFRIAQHRDHLCQRIAQWVKTRYAPGKSEHALA